MHNAFIIYLILQKYYPTKALYIRPLIIDNK